MSKLDRALCEKLGIEPKREWFRSENADGSWGESQTALSYPALSTTGEGMLRLMEALNRLGFHVKTVTALELRAVAIYRAGEKVASGVYVEQSQPMALALVAAATLGIKMQENV